MISNGAAIGIKAPEIRAMIPKDTWLCFAGWNKFHGPKQPGSEAPTHEQYQELVRRVDGGNSTRT